MRSTRGVGNRVTRALSQLLFRAWPTVVALGYPEASCLIQIYQKPCQETPFSFRRRRESSVRLGLPLRAAEPRNWQAAEWVRRSCRINAIAMCREFALNGLREARSIGWVRCRTQNTR